MLSCSGYGLYQEAGIGHDLLVDPEAADRYRVRERFLGVGTVVAHPELPPGIKRVPSPRGGVSSGMHSVTGRSDIRR
jgi:hypothetical protein